ncbi:MAG: hypothetical protein AAGJ46_02200 [Planctomycetota bacterium]
MLIKPYAPGRSRAGRLILLLVAAAACAGCEKKPPPTPAPPQPPPSPEEKFEDFLSELRRRVEGEQLAPTSISSGNATYTGGYRVAEHVITKPETEEGSYHARVTITEQANYSYLSPVPEEPEEEPSRRGPGFQEDEEGNLILEPDRAKAELRLRAADSPLKSHDQAERHEFELSFVDGEWRLRTSIPQDRPFLGAAFRLALSRQ